MNTYANVYKLSGDQIYCLSNMKRTLLKAKLRLDWKSV